MRTVRGPSNQTDFRHPRLWRATTRALKPTRVTATGATIRSSSSYSRTRTTTTPCRLFRSTRRRPRQPTRDPSASFSTAALYNPTRRITQRSRRPTTLSHAEWSHGLVLDDCDGHPGPGGQYHYHGLPSCLVAYATSGSKAQVASVTSTSDPRQAPWDEDNAAAKKPVILGCVRRLWHLRQRGYERIDNSVSALDACNGIFSPCRIPRGVYHYVLENVKGARSSIGCYQGLFSSAYTKALEADLSGHTARRVTWRSYHEIRDGRKSGGQYE